MKTISGLLSLGYQIGATMQRTTYTLFEHNDLVVTREVVEELGKSYIQIKGKHRSRVLEMRQRLGLVHVPESFLHLYFSQIRSQNTKQTPKQSEK